MFSAFLRTLASGAFAIHPQTGMNLFPHVLNFMEGKPSPFLHKGEESAQSKPFAVSTATVGKYGYDSFDNAPEGSIAVIPMAGVVMKYTGDCGEPGTQSYAARIQRALGHKNISAIILKVDSPGGMVDGTATLADLVKSSEKPIVAFVDDGMAASAMYWIISGATEIICSQKHDMVGSIGVYTTMADFKGYYDKLGLKVEDVYAPQSSEKNGSWREWAQDKNDKLIKEELGFIAAEFISAVKENRGAKLNASIDPFKGKIFYAPEAKKAGLIDAIGDFAYAVQRAEKLSKQSLKVNLK